MRSNKGGDMARAKALARLASAEQLDLHTMELDVLSEGSCELRSRIEAIDAANAGALDVSAVGDAVRAVLDLPRGKRPARVVVDAQAKRIEELNALHDAKQAAFFRQLGVDDLWRVVSSNRIDGIKWH